LPTEEIKKKINSVLKSASSAQRLKEPRLKKSIFSIFSKKSDQEQVKKISPIFQTTSLKQSISPDKSIKTKFLKDKLKNIYISVIKKAETWAKTFVRNLGFTEEFTGIWGLDIGTNYLKLLKISHEEGRPNLTHFSCEAIPPKFRSGGPRRSEYLKQLLRKLTLSYKAEGELVSSSIAEQSLITRTIKLPQMADSEIPKAVEWRLAQQYAVDLKSQIMSFIVLGEKEDRGVKQIEILSTTVPKEVVVEYFGLLKYSGLKPIAIEPDCFSLVFSYLENYQCKPEEVVVLLNIGARFTMFNIIAGTHLSFNRKILCGGRDFLSALANNLNLSFEEAEKKLKTFGIPKIDWQRVVSQAEEVSPSEEKQVFKTIQPVLEKLITEFRSSFDFYSYQMTHSTVQRIDKILIGGGASQIKNLDEFLSARLETPVEIFNPLKNIQIAEEIDKKLIGQFAPQLGVAIGSALRRTI